MLCLAQEPALRTWYKDLLYLKLKVALTLLTLWALTLPCIFLLFLLWALKIKSLIQCEIVFLEIGQVESWVLMNNLLDGLFRSLVRFQYVFKHLTRESLDLWPLSSSGMLGILYAPKRRSSFDGSWVLAIKDEMGSNNTSVQSSLWLKSFEIAWISLTLFVEANAKRKTVFSVRSLMEMVLIGSSTSLRYFSTTSISHGG